MDIHQQNTPNNTETFYLQLSKFALILCVFMFIGGMILKELRMDGQTLITFSIIVAFITVIKYNVPYIIVSKNDLTIQTTIISSRVNILFSEITSVVIKDNGIITVFYKLQNSDDTKEQKINIAYTSITKDVRVKDKFLNLLKEHLGDKFA